MTRIKFLIAAMLLVLVGANAKAEDKVVSETLLKELQRLSGEVLDAAKKDGIQSPPNVTDEELREATVHFFKAATLVSADEEARFKKGEFDEEANKKRMELFPKLYADLNAELPKAVAILLEAHKSGNLSGVRLELAVRINTMKAEEMRRAAAKKQ